MVDYAQARKIMLSQVRDKSWFNLCTECENAFVFSKYDDFSIGGTTAPGAVMKDSGKCYAYSAVLDYIGDTTGYYLMGKDGARKEITAERLDELQNQAMQRLRS